MSVALLSPIRLARMSAEISRLKAEIERLRAVLYGKCRQYDDDMRTMQNALNREIEARRALEQASHDT